MAVTCPCCGQDMAETDNPNVLFNLRASTQERRALHALILAFPLRLTYTEMRTAIYGSGDGDGGDKVPAIVASRLRAMVGTLGWTIPDGRTEGGYRLVRL